VLPLRNPIRPYAWGSRTAIAALQGRPSPADGPEAELWIGAHPSDPSVLSDGVSLVDAIAADPGLLGAPVVDQFGPRLPYLLKVLAAAEPLSLQAHPDADQARDGFAAEEAAEAAAGRAAGAAADRAAGAAERNYTDPHHKPELLVALDEFEALCGFADPRRSADVVESLGVDALAPAVEVLRRPDPAAALRGAVELLMGWPAADRAGLVAGVTSAARPARLDHVAELGARYPGDIGVVVAVLLNHVRLAPGEGVFMPAGNLHAYLRGLGVEVMAASDNVLRGGLTPKRVDVAELLRVLRFEVLARPVIAPEPIAPGLVTWAVPSREFRLVRATVGPDGSSPTVTLPAEGPREVLCVRGRVRLSAGAYAVDVAAGEAVFVPAATPSLQVGGDGEVFQAGTPGATSGG
jgi:mannose-6-phosphate isomerase